MSVAQDFLRRHPLQRVASPSRGFSAALHATSLACFAYSFRYLIVNPSPINAAYGWHLQYLTILGLSLATATMAIGLVADMTLSRSLFRVKNALSLTSAPLELLISFLYWGLRTIDRRLVLPDWAPPMDVFSDLAFHAFPTLLLLADALLLSPPRETSVRTSLLVSLAIALSYWYWIELCYAKNGFYPYPIFAALDTVGRIGLFTFSAVLMTAAGSIVGAFYVLTNGRILGDGLGPDKAKQ